MLDPNLFRNDLESVVKGLASRGFEFDQEAYRKLDSERRRVIQEAEVLKAERNRVSDEVAKIVRLDDVKTRLEGMGTLPAGSTPEEFAAFIDAETAKWGKVIREAKVKLD